MDPDFSPAQSRRRIAGWTPARQAAFVAALAEGHSVRDAAAGVGLSPRSAYALRRKADAAEFALAWAAAIDVGAMRLTETALSRALHGERRTVWYRGRAVGERVIHDNRLLLHLLTRQRSSPSRKRAGE
jgi:hypothetical protein